MARRQSRSEGQGTKARNARSASGTPARSGRGSGTGITNRGLGDELGEQQMLPPRGRRKLPKGEDQPMEPAPKKQRGRRRGEPGADVAVSRRARPATGEPAAAYGRTANARTPVSSRIARTTAAAGVRAKTRKPNRKTSGPGRP